MTEFNPAEVGIRPAATVMLVDDRPDLQIYMMERHADTIFAGGMWVFPGGSVDQADDHADFEAISVHRNDVQASRLMSMDSGGLAYYVAAIREAFEEAGILLALHREGHQPLTISDADVEKRFEIHRDHVNDGSRAFIDIVKDENLILDVGQMHYIARWITPVGPPRRFDARFFISRMPKSQTPLHDNRELVHAEWLPPRAILEKVEADEMVLMSPTLRMIKCLAQFDSADQVIAAASANQPDHRARVTPERVIVLPGESGYESADENIETGWVRLRPLS